MTTPSPRRLLIDRQHLDRTRLVDDPEAPGARTLAEGEARLAIDTFSLTANNITYAAFGEAMKYWQFFPAPEADRAQWACLPVWGFADVVESRADGVATGRRLWGYYPAGTHLVVRPARVGAAGFVDGSAHRQELAAVYNQYVDTAADPGWKPELEGLQAVLRPLFTTSFLIDDFLPQGDDREFFGARQLLLSSASSKTAFGTAFCLARRGTRPRVVGLTSPGNLAFTRALGCYDRVLPYADVATLDSAEPTVYIDFSGDALLRRAVHERFGDASLKHSASIGGTHWQALGSGGGLPGPRPTLFFAPAQVKKRAAPPPEGWGPAGLQQRLGEAWAAFLQRIAQADPPWVRIVTQRGPQALQTAYLAMLAGQVPPTDGLMLQPRG